MLYSNPWKRLIAYILDSLILSVPLHFIYSAFGIAYLTANHEILKTLETAAETNSLTPDMLWQILFSIIPFFVATFVTTIIAYWLYSAAMESSSKQATLGKMVFDMKVTDAHGLRIGFGKASLRFFVKYLSSLFFIIYLVIFFTEKKQTLHDLAVSTVVVNK